jgi:hypothetical protein
MAIFQLEIADEDVDRVLQAVSLNNGWRAQITNPEHVVTFDEETGDPILPVVDGEGNPIPEMIDNPESVGDCTHRMVRSFLIEHVAAYEINEAKRLAAEAVNTDVNISDPVV